MQQANVDQPRQADVQQAAQKPHIAGQPSDLDNNANAVAQQHAADTNNAHVAADNRQPAPDSALRPPAEINNNQNAAAVAKRSFDEAYLTNLLVNLAQKPDIAVANQQLDPAVANMIGSLSSLKAEQWEVQLQQNIAQLLENPPLAEALHNVAINAGVDTQQVPAGNEVAGLNPRGENKKKTYKKAEAPEETNREQYQEAANLKESAHLKNVQERVNSKGGDINEQHNAKDKTLTLDKDVARDKLEQGFNNRDLDRAIKDNLAAG